MNLTFLHRRRAEASLSTSGRRVAERGNPVPESFRWAHLRQLCRLWKLQQRHQSESTMSPRVGIWTRLIHYHWTGKAFNTIRASKDQFRSKYVNVIKMLLVCMPISSSSFITVQL